MPNGTSCAVSKRTIGAHTSATPGCSGCSQQRHGKQPSVCEVGRHRMSEQAIGEAALPLICNLSDHALYLLSWVPKPYLIWNRSRQLSPCSCQSVCSARPACIEVASSHLIVADDMGDSAPPLPDQHTA